MITSYGELQTQVISWSNHNESGFTNTVQDCIKGAESWIKTEVRHPTMERRATATVSTSSRYLATPDNFLAPKRFHLQTTPLTEVEYVTPDQINYYNSSTSGKPLRYSIIGDEFVFDRIPDSAYTAEIGYYVYADLSASQTSNDILARYPQLYLYGALAEVYAFMKDSKRQMEYSALRDRLIQKINSEAKNQRYGSSIAVRGTVGI
jgi:hypothetical protein